MRPARPAERAGCFWILTQASFSPRRCTTALALLRSLQDAPPGSAAVASTLALVGEHMRQAHRGYTALGLGAPELDAMLEALDAEIGLAGGVYGARISGGGSGGTVVVLCQLAALPRLRALADKLHGSPALPTLLTAFIQ